ncbi:hypothetical protein A5761_09830 [Mycolicibacterium setense]|nr:hypothetical protein A5761_09830 [Mycolicibacterium setense]
MTALIAAIQKHGLDPAARAMVLRADGPGFCGGAELHTSDEHPRDIREWAYLSLSLMRAITDYPAPVVLAVHGYCIGLGVLIAGVCDVIVSAPRVPFALADARGYVPSNVVEAMGLLPEKYLNSSRYPHATVTSEELSSSGLVELADPEAVTRVAHGVANRLTAKRREGVRDVKAMVNGDLRRRLRIAFDALEDPY